jgi:hypothetical protein
MSLFIDYTIALCNLYGFVEKQRVLKIYNEHNFKEITIDDMELELSDFRSKLEKCNIEVAKDYIYLYELHDLQRHKMILEEKSKLPFYVPNKQILLKYKDLNYREKNDAYIELKDFVLELFDWIDESNIEQYMLEIGKYLYPSINMASIREVLEASNLDWRKKKEYNKLFPLLTKYSENMRIWNLNGHTVYELFVLSHK